MLAAAGPRGDDVRLECGTAISNHKNTILPVNNQMNSLASAIQRIRRRLKLSQAGLAEKLGCQQNAVSKYQAGKVQPGMEILAKLWDLADLTERSLIRNYIYERFFFLSELETEPFTNTVKGRPRPFPLAMIEVLKRPEAPTFLRRIMNLYLGYRRYPNISQPFEQAITWLEVQLQILRRLDQTKGVLVPDDIQTELLQEASELLPKTQQTNVMSSSSKGGRKRPRASTRAR